MNKKKKKVKVKKNGEVRIPCPLQKRGKFFVEGQDLSLSDILRIEGMIINEWTINEQQAEWVSFVYVRVAENCFFRFQCCECCLYFFCFFIFRETASGQVRNRDSFWVGFCLCYGSCTRREREW